jgi:hypothetical protein
MITDIGRHAAIGAMIGPHLNSSARSTENHREFIDLTDPRYVHYRVDTAQISWARICWSSTRVLEHLHVPPEGHGHAQPARRDSP